jgi:phage-related holin
MTNKERAVVAFFATTVISAAITKTLDKEADAVGVPHVLVSLLVAALAHEMG